MKKSKLIPSLLAGALLLGLTGAATAGTASAAFTAGVTVNTACQVSGTPVNFGSIGILADAGNNIAGADNLQVTSTLTFNCTAAAPITVSVSGLALTTPVAGRFRMFDAISDVLQYRISQDAAGTKPWDTSSPNTLAMTATVGTATVPMYFTIKGADNAGPAGVAVPVRVGNYAGTATVTVTF